MSPITGNYKAQLSNARLDPINALVMALAMLLVSIKDFNAYIKNSFASGEFDPMKAMELFMRILTNFSFLGAVIGVVVAVFLISALVSPIANFTTGITIAHTGFTPNPNVTNSPGAVPILQLYTFLFVVLGLVVIYRYAAAEMPRGGL